jgi:hypothetical protein
LAEREKNKAEGLKRREKEKEHKSHSSRGCNLPVSGVQLWPVSVDVRRKEELETTRRSRDALAFFHTSRCLPVKAEG